MRHSGGEKMEVIRIVEDSDLSIRKTLELLGHSRIQTTLDIYSHSVPSMHAAAADKMDEMLSGLARRATETS